MSKKKKAVDRQLREQLGVENRRGETFVGYRPCVFQDRRRRMEKQETRRLIREYA